MLDLIGIRPVRMPVVVGEMADSFRRGRLMASMLVSFVITIQVLGRPEVDFSNCTFAANEAGRVQEDDRE